MATLEVEKLIHQLEPHYLQALSDYLEYLMYLQQKQNGKNGVATKTPAPAAKVETTKPSVQEIPERLRVMRKYRGIAPKPHFPVTKYDVYKQ